MEVGQYTPTPTAANLGKEHCKVVSYITQGDGSESFRLELDGRHPLTLTDGGHRLAAIDMLLDEASSRLNAATSEPERAKWQTKVQEINSLPITCTLYLDGNSRHDFVNLQQGRQLDASHLFSLRVRQNLCEDKEQVLAFEVAQSLHKKDDSPFKKLIRFDSRGVLPLPVTTLCSRGSSDLATSLVGLAKVGTGRFDANRLTEILTVTYRTLKTRAPELLASGKVLTPIAEDGSKGSATMLIGLAVCLAHRAAGREGGNIDDVTMNELVEAAKETLDKPVDRGFSGPQKRELMRRFAVKFFANDQNPKHQEIPVALLRTLSASAFGVPPLPKEPRAKTTRRKKPVTTTPSVPAPTAVEGSNNLLVSGSLTGDLVA
jgi:hypothetical protein